MLLHVQNTPRQGYLTKAVQSFYGNLKDDLSDSQEMKNTCKVAKRSEAGRRCSIKKAVLKNLVIFTGKCLC